MKVVGITQARTGSSRFPSKVLKKVGDVTLLELHLNRLKRSKMLDEIIVATTTKQTDDIIVEIAEKSGVMVFRGSENNVLERYFQAWELVKTPWIVRITSDCPLVDPGLLDEITGKAIEKGYDYFSNVLKESYPDGMDVEVFKAETLEQTYREAELNYEKEHVTQYMIRHSDFKGGRKFKAGNFEADGNYNDIRLTVDEPRDFEVIKTLIHKLGAERSWKEYADYYKKHLQDINSDILRNEGLKRSKDHE